MILLSACAWPDLGSDWLTLNQNPRNSSYIDAFSVFTTNHLHRFQNHIGIVFERE